MKNRQTRILQYNTNSIFPHVLHRNTTLHHFEGKIEIFINPFTTSGIRELCTEYAKLSNFNSSNFIQNFKCYLITEIKRFNKKKIY